MAVVPDHGDWKVRKGQRRLAVAQLQPVREYPGGVGREGGVHSITCGLSGRLKAT